MKSAIMINIDGDIEKLAMELYEIERIIPRYTANLVFLGEGQDLLLELNGRTYPVHGKVDKEFIRPFFIVLKSGSAINATEYQLLFNVEELPNSIVSGIGITGHKHLCKINMAAEGHGNVAPLTVKGQSDHPGINDFSSEDAEQLKEVIQRQKKYFYV